MSIKDDFTEIRAALEELARARETIDTLRSILVECIVEYWNSPYDTTEAYDDVIERAQAIVDRSPLSSQGPRGERERN